MKNHKKFTARIVSLGEAYELAYKVSLQIIESGYQPDCIVAIARGGYPPARFFADFLGVKSVTSIQIGHYAAGAQAQEEVQASDNPDVDLFRKKILVADDVNDTGDTLDKAMQTLNTLSPADIKTAVLHEKHETSRKADYAGDYLQEWNWLIYQWAAVEDIIDFIRNSDGLPPSPEAAREILLKKYDLKPPDHVMEKAYELLFRRQN